MLVNRKCRDVDLLHSAFPIAPSMFALVHGFVMLEFNDQMRRGGDLNEAFEQSVRALIRGWRPAD